MLLELGKLELNELHTECGPVLAGALIEQDLADEFLIYLAPKLMGTDSRGMFVLPGVLEMAQIKKLRWRDMSRVGEDLRIIAEPERE